MFFQKKNLFFFFFFSQKTKQGALTPEQKILAIKTHVFYHKTKKNMFFKKIVNKLHFILLVDYNSYLTVKL